MNGFDVRSVVRPFSPANFPYLRFAAALALGAGGGWLFARYRMPLPWMLGSMTACTLAALLRAPVAGPPVMRPPMSMLIGVMLGSAFSPQFFGQLGAWMTTLAGLVLFLLVAGAACVAYLHFVAGLDRTTAYFAGMPGGLVEMVVLGGEQGGDTRTIALLHTARILLIVFTLPFLVQIVGGVSLGARASVGTSVADTSWQSGAWLAGTALTGAVLGNLLNLRAAFLIGPMLASAVVHILGWTDFTPPTEVVNGAQLVLGTIVGCSFIGTEPMRILRILAVAFGATVILLAATLLFAVGLSSISAYGVVPLMLAYSPGGITEMSLIALALHIEIAFVAAHHIVRLFLVITGASLIFGLLKKRTKDMPGG
ncbi:MAG: AbrB family transcriptional regulator [Hyphomicrobiaceae bacterium]